MSEPRAKIGTAPTQTTAVDRAKSLRDIDEQYSRIDNRLYQQYINFEIDEETYRRRKARINAAYDRYQTNIVQMQSPGWQRGMAYPYSFQYRRRVSRSDYAKK